MLSAAARRLMLRPASDQKRSGAGFLLCDARPPRHAAALEPQLFASVKLHGCLESWARVVRTPLSQGQFENVVHGALKTYDLPDLLKTLPKQKVTWSDPVDALGQPLGQ